jgi:hypothetical protein
VLDTRRGQGLKVSLEAWEYEWASHVGARRYTANWGKADAPWYDAERMEDDRTAQVAACVCELAVAKATNRYWSGHVWPPVEHKQRRDTPDVGHNIEVRRVRTSLKAAVRRHQVGKGLVLVVAYAIPPEFREVDVMGWIHMDEAWEVGVPPDWDPKDSRVVSPSHLTPIGGGGGLE